MKILRKNEGLVSNFEMCELLKQRELKRHEQVGGGTEVGDEENNEFDNNNKIIIIIQIVTTKGCQ